MVVDGAAPRPAASAKRWDNGLHMEQYQRTPTDIDSGVYRRALELADALGRGYREVLDELIEESVRSREHPGIVFKGGPAGRRAAVAGTGLDVWEIVEMHRSMGRELLLDSMANVSERALSTALSYREAHPEEIEAAIEENALPPEHWHRLHPGAVPPAPGPSGFRDA